MRDLYRRIWRHTWRVQIFLVVLSVCVAVLAAVPLQYQKDIVNGLTDRMQHQDLIILGAELLGVLILSALLKAALGYRMAAVGEDIIRRARTNICIGQANKDRGEGQGPAQQGTLAVMIAAEAEEVGKFVGAAIASPLMQVGTLVSVVAFIAWNQPYLALLVLGVVAPQAIIVVALQRQINARVSERVRALRRATDRIVAEDIARMQQEILADFDEIYEVRRNIYLLKQSSKFALNVINAGGTAGILVLGGWFVLDGRLDVGTVVAALSGLTRLSQPWRELLTFYRELSAVRVKYELLRPALPGAKNSR